MIYEPSYIYPNVLNAQGERCFYTMTDNTFRILINSDYPIASCTYRIFCPDGVLYKTGTVMGLNFYTNNIDGTQNLLEIGEVSLLNSSNKVRINSTTEINPNVFSNSTWTYQLSFTDTQGTPMDTNLYAFYITPSPDFVGVDIVSDPEVALTDTTPYLHRASPQDVASSMKLKKIVGGTVAWNQLMDGYSYTANSGGKTTNFPSGVQIVAGHKLLMMAQTSGYATTDTWIFLYTRANNTNSRVGLNIKTDRTLQGQIIVPSVGGAGGHANSNGDAWVYQTNADVDISDVMLIDLTQMFGTQIADYIYSLEQAHAGDGVAWFKALFPNDYYAYDSGELMSVKTSARKTYNADNVEIGSYALDGDLELRGIPKLDADHKLYYDGDTYASDGTVTRKYGTVTFDGSWDESWIRGTSAGYDGYRFYIANALTGAKLPNTGRGFVLANHGVYDAVANAVGVIFLYNSNGNGQLFFYPPTNITEVADFKTWLGSNNLTVVYELATSTTESADAYTQSQRVGATEEFVDGRTVEIPVGNVSEYYETTYPSRTISFTGNFTYASQPISWIQWSVYDSSDNLVYTTGMVYRSVATNFTFDGFDTGETYTVEFSASDTRGNISRATQQVSVSYTLVNQSNVIRTVVQDDSSMLVDWSGLQPIIGKAYNSGGTEVATPTFFVNNIPSTGHNSIKMNTNSTEKRVTFQSSDNLDIAIEETDFITWSGALYGNTTGILTATSNDGVMSLSLVDFNDGLYPNNSLYPSSSLYPKVVTLGRFKYTLPNGTIIYSDQNIDATNSWFFVELSPNKITVHREEYYKA